MDGFNSKDGFKEGLGGSQPTYPESSPAPGYQPGPSYSGYQTTSQSAPQAADPDSVYTMPQSIPDVPLETEGSGRVLLPFIGAVVGALIGAVAWALVGILGYYASVIGILIAFLAGKGWEIMGGRSGGLKIFVVILVSLIAVIAGTVGAYGFMLRKEIIDSLGFTPNLDYMVEIGRLILYDPTWADVRNELLRNLGVGLLFAAIGVFSVIRGGFSRRKA